MTTSRRQQLEALRSMTDEEIDFSDAPEATDQQLSRPDKFELSQATPFTISVTLDEVVFQYFRGKQTEGEINSLINAVLRQYVEQNSEENS